ncbi:hypothetical protein [Ferroplasma sp.]|uniref:hypothetical protein n=1 Tax=Ferroplasma sp. TaxID=2591003 RepID=UPI00307D8E0D
MEVLYNNNKTEIDEKGFFIASRNPLYYGLIVNPSSDLWSYMVQTNMVECVVEKKKEKFTIPYRIDVGENSIFFIKPE